MLKNIIITFFIILWMSVTHLTWSAPSITPSYQELYQRVFGYEPTLYYQTLQVRLRINNIMMGTLTIDYPSYGDEIKIHEPSFSAHMKKVLNAEYLEKYLQQIKGKKYLTQKELHKMGYKSDLNAIFLVLNVHVPGPHRGSQQVLLSQRYNQPDYESLAPNRFSSYLNTKFKRTFNLNTHDDHLKADYQTGLYLNQWFLTQTLKSDHHENKHFISDHQLSYDDVGRNARFNIGDLQFPVLGQGQYIQMTGLGYTKGYLLPEYKPITQYQLTLEEASRIEIWVNGDRQLEQRLDEGVYDLRDFPVSYGYNLVTIRIIGDSGKKSEAFFPFIYDTSFIPEKEHHYSLNLGLPYHNDLTYYRREYQNKDNTTLSFFHNYGLSSRYLLGWYTQAKKDRQILGARHVLGFKNGKLAVDYVRSRDKDIGWGSALESHFSSYQGFKTISYWGLGATVRETDYLSINDSSGSSISHTVFAFINFRLGEKDYAGLRFNQTLYRRSDSEKKHAINMWMNKQLTRNLTSNLQSIWSKKDAESLDWKLTVSVQYRWGQQYLRYSQSIPESHGKQVNMNIKPDPSQDFRITASSYESENSQSNRIGLRQNFGRNRYFDTTVETQGDGNETQSILLSYKGQRGFVSHRIRSSGEQTVDIETALVYSNGHFGWSNPIQSAFVIVHPHPSLKDKTIYLNPEGKIDRFGPAVVQNLQLFRNQELQVKSLENMPGYYLGKSQVSVYAYDHAGYTFQLGGNNNIILSSVLKTSDGKPISRAFGRLVPLSKVGDSKVVITNKKGKVQISGLEPGDYKLIIRVGKEELSTTIRIPDHALGLYKVKEIVITP